MALYQVVTTNIPISGVSADGSIIELSYLAGLQSKSDPTKIKGNTTVDRYATAGLAHAPWLSLDWAGGVIIDSEGWGRKMGKLTVAANEDTASRSANIYLNYIKNGTTTNSAIRITVILEGKTVVNYDYSQLIFYNPTNYDFYTTKDIYVCLTKAGDSGFAPELYPVIIPILENTIFLKNNRAFTLNENEILLIEYKITGSKGYGIFKTLYSYAGVTYSGPYININDCSTVGYNTNTCTYPINKDKNYVYNNYRINDSLTRIINDNLEVCCFESYVNKSLTMDSGPVVCPLDKAYLKENLYQVSKIYESALLLNNVGIAPYTFYDKNLKPYKNTYNPSDSLFGEFNTYITYPGELQINCYCISVYAWVNSPSNKGFTVYESDITHIIIFTIKNNNVYALYFERNDTLTSFFGFANNTDLADPEECKILIFTLSKNLLSKQEKIYNTLNGIDLKKFNENTKYGIDKLNINVDNIYILDDNNMTSYDLFFPDKIIINGENISNNFEYTIVAGLSDEKDGYAYRIINDDYMHETNGFKLHINPFYDSNDTSTINSFAALPNIYNIWKNNLFELCPNRKIEIYSDDPVKYYGINIEVTV